MKPIIYISICLVASILACNKEKLIYERVYFEFEMPFSITPGSDTIKVGDTLTMEANFSDSLYDRKSQRKIYLPAFDFNNLFACYELISDSIKFIQQPGGLSKFNFTISAGTGMATSNRFATLGYLYFNGQYKLKFHLVPKEKGVFSIILSAKNPNGMGLIELPQSLAPHSPDVKRFPVIQFNRYIFNQGNTHQHLFLQHCKQIDFTDSVDRSHSIEAIYTFVVK